MSKILDVLFGCTHKHCTFPITAKHSHAGSAEAASTYIVCLDCGKEFAYDWQKMRVLSALKDAA